MRYTKSKFQFHKGTIRTVVLKPVLPSALDFNSIKVRLEQNRPNNNTAAQRVFQFHKGTIRTKESSFKDVAKNISIP